MKKKYLFITYNYNIMSCRLYDQFLDIVKGKHQETVTVYITILCYIHRILQLRNNIDVKLRTVVTADSSRQCLESK